MLHDRWSALVNSSAWQKTALLEKMVDEIWLYLLICWLVLIFVWESEKNQLNLLVHRKVWGKAGKVASSAVIT